MLLPSQLALILMFLILVRPHSYALANLNAGYHEGERVDTGLLLIDLVCLVLTCSFQWSACINYQLGHCIIARHIIYNTTMDPEIKPAQQFSTAEQEQVGISCYISKGKPIPAVTKFLLTDFIVNEIAEDGTVIKLDKKPDLSTINNNKPNAAQPVSYEMTKQLLEQIQAKFDKGTADAIAQLYKRMEQGEKVTQWQHLTQNMPEMSKQDRTKIHAFVRQKLTNIESNTLDGNKMKLKLNKKMRKINPAARNKYIHFKLFKSNVDTMGAIFKLSKLTGVNQKLFSSAGLKDKRGVTTQMISVYNTELTALQKFYAVANRNKQMWIEGFKENMDKDIGVGQLYGNQFGLILRLINPSDADLIGERVQSLREYGMINYFGMQRFGSCNTKTYMIGFKILKREWKQIVEDILLEDTKDQHVNKLKLDCYNKEQYARAQRELPNKYKIEKNLFTGLKRHGKNYQNVFESLPRSMKTLYLHSLQSYLWNRMVSKRIIDYGLQVQVGDLVGKKLTGFNLAMKQIEDDKINPKEDNQNNVNKQQQVQQPQIQQQDIEDKYETHLIENQDQASNYNFTDVLFPLYGPSINLPENSLAFKYLSDELKAMGLNHEEFTQNSKKLCFKGMFRKMVIKPEKVSYAIISHQNAKDQVQSPFYLNGQSLQTASGDRKAVQVVLQLPKSAYATMALREILHIPSSFDAQMVLNRLYENSNNNKESPAEKQQINNEPKQ